MKKKNVFQIVFFVVVLGLSTLNGIFAKDFINQEELSERYNITYDGIQWDIDDFLTNRIIENYGVDGFFEYDKTKVSEDTIRLIINEMGIFNSSYLPLDKDENFSYEIIDTLTGESIDASENLPEKENSSVYQEYTIGTEDNFIYQRINDELEQVLTSEEFQDLDIKVKLPSKYIIRYSIPTEINLEGYGYIKEKSLGGVREYSFTYSIIVNIILGIVMCLFILFAPYTYEEENNPFSMIKQWKLELSLTIFILLSFAAGGFIVLLFGSTITGEAQIIVHRFLENVNAEFLISGLMILVSIFYFLFIASVMFLIKHIFYLGFKKTIKDYTLLGSTAKFFKKGYNNIFEMNFKKKQSKYLFLALLLNFIVICICSLLFVGGWLLGFIYTLITLIFLEKKLRRIELDHMKFMSEIRMVADGNFNLNLNGDVGVFNPLQDELANVKEGFQKAVQEEMKSSNMKTELITNVSHDLKTPITCIRNYVELLSGEEVGEEAREEYLENLNLYTGRLEHLIEDLFDVSKANSGNINLDIKEIDIKELIEQVVIEVEESMVSKSLTVKTNYNLDSGILQLDGNKTYRVFENLFNNVCKYALEGTRVYVDVKEQEESIQIEIKNISKTELNFDTESILERFNRGDSSRHEEGSGLGLAIVQSFVELQKGTFKVEVDGDLFKAILRFSKERKEIV